MVQAAGSNPAAGANFLSMLRTIKVRTTRVDEIEVTIDDSVINEAWMKDFARVFHPLDGPDDVAHDMGFNVMRFGPEDHYEGYGNVKKLHKDGKQMHLHTTDTTDGYRRMKEDEYAPGITVKVIEHDDDYDIEVEEITKTNRKKR